MQDQATPYEPEAILRGRGWTLNEKKAWISPHDDDGWIGKAFTLEGACAREKIRYREAVLPSSNGDEPIEAWGLDANLEPLPSRPAQHRKPPPGIVPGRVYNAGHGFYVWRVLHGFVPTVKPTDEGDVLPWPEEAEQFRPTPPITAEDLPPIPEDSLPLPDGAWLLRRYEPLTNVRPVDDQFIESAFRPEEKVEASYREAVIPEVYAGGSLAILGSKKNTTSIQCEELAVTLATGSAHWGLPEFTYRGEPKRVLLIQEENDPEALEQDLVNILEARGLPADALKGRMRVLSRQRFNLMNEGHRAAVAGMCEGVYGREGYDVLILDRVDKMGVTDITNAAGELQGFLNWLTAIQEVLGTWPIISWPRVSNAKAFTFDTCLGGETIPRWWQGGMLVQRRDPCRVDVRVDMLRHRLGEHRHRLDGVSPPGQVGEWELRDTASDGETTKREATLKRGVQLDRFRATLEAKPDISNKEAAEELGCSDKTITRYRKALAAERESASE